jgi:linoleoyl-CoA desaturase
MPKVTFKKEKLFLNSLNTQVENYFKSNNLKKSGNKKLYFKSLLLILSAILIYSTLLSFSFNLHFSILLCCAFGFVQATIGFNVMHDANHGSFSDKKWINTLMSLTANIMGVNAWMWKQKHNIIHHTYTNVDGVDSDIGRTSWLRMCPSQKQFKAHRFQHIYCIPLYALTSLSMFAGDFTKYFQKNINGTSLRKMETAENMLFWSSKAVYIFLFIVLPSFIAGFIPAFLGFIIMHIALGLTLSIVFQLAHVVEITHFQHAGAEGLQVQDEWAVHQVLTTADFATDSRIVSWFTGGLNFQVEHHLFPKISHVHYPVIHQFVKKSCHEHSIRFNSYPSMSAALRSHFAFMKQLGVQ